MNQSVQHTSKKGYTFTITTADAPVPPTADYWGFLFKVVESGSGKGRTYRAMFKKDTFATKEGAAAFLLGDPLMYLRNAFLENYVDGSHPVLWPVIRDGWVVI